MTTQPTAVRLPQALGERIDIHPVVELLRPLIVESLSRIEKERRLPEELIDAMYAAGLFSTLLPRELDGLELHPCDQLDLLYELARISGSVAWVAYIQCGHGPLVAPELMLELRERAGGRWMVSGSHNRLGRARRVDGGYVFNGHWSFASGTPWATYMSGFALVVDESGDAVRDPETGEREFVVGLFFKDQITYLDRWDALGMRGTSSGQFTAEEAFVEDRLIIRNEEGVPSPYNERPLYNVPWPGESVIYLGCAQGALDIFIELADRPPRTDELGGRTAAMGADQINQVDIAEADAMIRAARGWVHDIHGKLYDRVVNGDPDTALLHSQCMQASTYCARVAKRAVGMVFDMAGSDAVIVGRGIERCFRDVHTATQHNGALRRTFVPHGQRLLHRDVEPLFGGPLAGPPDDDAG